MHKNQFEKNWNHLKKSIREKWDKLTDTDMDTIRKKFDQFIHKLHQKYGDSKGKIEKEIKSWRSKKASDDVERTEREKKTSPRIHQESPEKKRYEKSHRIEPVQEKKKKRVNR